MRTTVRLFEIILRTKAEKSDRGLSWARPDIDFFGAGACHILAAAFIDSYPDAGFRAVMLKPVEGHVRGAHVVVSNGHQIFDCRGWHEHFTFLTMYSAAMQSQFPGWSCRLLHIDRPDGWDFCKAHNHRHPSQFILDPLLRAKTFLAQFPGPAP
jgi:hypothetical protein